MATETETEMTQYQVQVHEQAATRADLEQMGRVTTEEIGPGKVQEQTFADQRLEALAVLGIRRPR